MLPVYVQREAERQKGLLEVKRLLESREAGMFDVPILDVTQTLAGSKSKVVSGALAKGGKVLGFVAPGFAGVLRSKDGRLRLGAEMAQYARTRGVLGIFHSDELPGYGITEEEVSSLRIALGTAEGDAFVICADEAARAKAALEAAMARANLAFDGVPEETRDPQPDGSTSYSRPLPGASRMYPETDVRPIVVSEERLRRIREGIPELPEQTVRRFVEAYGLHEQQASQIVKDGYEEVFEEAARLDLAAVAARTLLNTLPELEREGVEVAALDESKLREALLSLKKGEFAKEAMPDVLREMAGGRTAEEAVGALGIQKADGTEARTVIASIVMERGDFVREKGTAAVGPLMAVVMEKLKGRLDGRAASEMLKEEISRFLSSI
jgi:glutamyl-tRNA(Gln) amidotransferase subunit E